MSKAKKDGFQKAGAKIHFFFNAKKNKKRLFLVTKVIGNKSNVGTTEQSFYAYLYLDLNVFMDFAGLQC